MKRVLLTGMSGTGKSSVVRELLARGYKAVDTDDGWSEPQPDGRQMWRENAIQALLAAEDADVLFVAGCEENQAAGVTGAYVPHPGAGYKRLSVALSAAKFSGMSDTRPTSVYARSVPDH
jgi:hypothetical protein